MDGYFTLSKRRSTKKQTFIEKPITQTIKATYQDPNIQIPMVVVYRTPSMKTREARVLDFISSYLSDGRSSKLYKKVVDEKDRLTLNRVGFSQEDYGMLYFSLPMETHTAADLLNEIDEEIVKFKRI
jgi:predicted Zn-dependent peptidase